MVSSKSGRKNIPNAMVAALVIRIGQSQANGARTAFAVAAGSMKTLNMPVNPLDTLGRFSVVTGDGAGVITFALIIHPPNRRVRYPVSVMPRLHCLFAACLIASAGRGQVLPAT